MVLLLTKLAGFVDVTGENGNGESDEEAECDNGVVRSETLGLLFSRGSCVCARGMGTPWCVVRDVVDGRSIIDVEGDDEDDEDCDLRCVGCE